MNELRVELYAQLMAAQDRIAQVLYARGVSHDAVLAALDGVDERLSPQARREDLYVSALAHYVAALGGRLEVRAVFGDDVIVVRSSRPAPRADDTSFTTCRQAGHHPPDSLRSQWQPGPLPRRRGSRD